MTRKPVLLTIFLVLVVLVLASACIYLLHDTTSSGEYITPGTSNEEPVSSEDSSSSEAYNITDNVGIVDEPVINMEQLTNDMNESFTKYVDAVYEYNSSTDSIVVTVSSGDSYSIEQDTETQTLSIYKPSGALLDELDLSSETDLRTVGLFIAEALSNI